VIIPGRLSSNGFSTPWALCVQSVHQIMAKARAKLRIDCLSCSSTLLFRQDLTYTYNRAFPRTSDIVGTITWFKRCQLHSTLNTNCRVLTIAECLLLMGLTRSKLRLSNQLSSYQIPTYFAVRLRVNHFPLGLHWADDHVLAHGPSSAKST